MATDIYEEIQKQMDLGGMMSKKDCAELHNLDKKFRAFDYALPQQWVDAMYNACPLKYVANHFVWVYEENDMWGSPYPLTKEGFDALRYMARSV
jgi:hypothetical protein